MGVGKGAIGSSLHVPSFLGESFWIYHIFTKYFELAKECYRRGLAWLKLFPRQPRGENLISWLAENWRIPEEVTHRETAQAGRFGKSGVGFNCNPGETTEVTK